MSRISSSLHQLSPSSGPGIDAAPEGLISQSSAGAGSRTRTRQLWLGVSTALAMGAAAVAVIRRPVPPRIETAGPARQAFAATAPEKRPTDSVQQGVDQFRAGSPKDARRRFLSALSSKNPRPFLLVNIGMTYKVEKDFTNARKYYAAAIDADPGYAPAYNNLGMLFAEENDWKSAVKLLRKAVSLDARLAPALLNLARAYERAGSWPLASRFYARYLDTPGVEPLVRALVERRLKMIRLFALNDPTASILGSDE